MSISRLTRSPAGQAILAWLAAGYIRLVYATSRWTVEGEETAERLWDEGRPFVVAFWHGRMLMMPCRWRRGIPCRIMISAHRDGRLIARTIRHFGVGAVTGSSRRGGAAAYREALRALAGGTCLGITPDGPRGPRMRAQAGLAHLAARAGVPVVPATCAFRRRVVLGSWDRFALPLPFNRGLFRWDAPIEVPADAGAEELERVRLLVEERLNAITEEADARFGHAPIPPAEARP